MGARHALAPVLDTARDPRWGRIEETYGEDPYLATVQGLAYVQAIQGPSLADGVVATAKHMVGHGLAEGGLNQAPVHAGRRELLDEQLAPFEAAVREGRIGSIMPAYCEVDGVPCHASAYLLDDILRRQWGFDGIVASDYMAVEMLSTAHRLTGDLGVAAGLALGRAWTRSCRRPPPTGRRCSPRSRTGGLTRPTWTRSSRACCGSSSGSGCSSGRTSTRRRRGDRRAAGRRGAGGPELAERSIVLVQNDGLLPLAADPGRIAVIGPIADSARDLIGDYGHLLHIETLSESLTGSTRSALGDGDGIAAGMPSSPGGRTMLTRSGRAFGAEPGRVHERGTGLEPARTRSSATAVERRAPPTSRSWSWASGPA